MRQPVFLAAARFSWRFISRFEGCKQQNRPGGKRKRASGRPMTAPTDAASWAPPPTARNVPNLSLRDQCAHWSWQSASPVPCCLLPYLSGEGRPADCRRYRRGCRCIRTGKDGRQSAVPTGGDAAASGRGRTDGRVPSLQAGMLLRPGGEGRTAECRPYGRGCCCVQAGKRAGRLPALQAGLPDPLTLSPP